MPWSNVLLSIMTTYSYVQLQLCITKYTTYLTTFFTSNVFSIFINVNYSGYPIPEDYDYSKSTELNYAIDISKYEQPYFKGKYAKYRETLDYTYHKYYSPARLQFHDKLIDIFLDHDDTIDLPLSRDRSKEKKAMDEGGKLIYQARVIRLEEFVKL